MRAYINPGQGARVLFCRGSITLGYLSPSVARTSGDGDKKTVCVYVCVYIN